jgi:hypothetical protein
VPTPTQIAYILSLHGAPPNDPLRDLKYVGMASCRPYQVQNAPGVPGRYSATFIADGKGSGIVTFTPNTPITKGPETIPQVDYVTFDYIEILGMFLPASTGGSLLFTGFPPTPEDS